MTSENLKNLMNSDAPSSFAAEEDLVLQAPTIPAQQFCFPNDGPCTTAVGLQQFCFLNDSSTTT